MELRDLRYLAASALAGNFTAAAGSLGLNSSTISRRIARLEDELGVTLFERGHFGIRLTSAGRAIMVDVRRALDDIEAIERSGQLNGRGRIGRIRLSLRMPPVGEPLRSLLASWHAACASVTLHLYELNDYDLRAAFADRRLDAAFVTRHTLWPEALANHAFGSAIDRNITPGNLTSHWLFAANVIPKPALTSARTDCLLAPCV